MVLKKTEEDTKRPVENDESPPNPTDWDIPTLESLVNDPNNNFRWGFEMDYNELSFSVMQSFVYRGYPIMLRKTTENWNRDLFSWHWLKKNFSKKKLIQSPRNNDTSHDLNGWTVGKYVDYLLKDSRKRNPPRLYGKDVPCPDEWKEYLESKLHPYLVYHGENDITSDLPLELQPISLMIYLGFEENFTPCHYDILGSLGHNIMVYTDSEDSCSVWFAFSSDDKDQVSKFLKAKAKAQQFHSSVYHDNFFISLEELKEAPFPVFVFIQKEGDMVLVPPGAPHQVVNKNGRSIKVSWNIMSCFSIATSYSFLSEYQKHLKPEIYKVKSNIYYSLLKRIKRIKNGDESQKIYEELSIFCKLFDHILFTESINTSILKRNQPLPSPQKTNPTIEQFLHDTVMHSRVCDFCHCDIWNRCFHCGECEKDSKDLDFCLNCVAQGRGCAKHKLNLVLKEYISEEECQSIFGEASKLLEKISKKYGYKPIDTISLRKPKEISNGTIAFNRVQLFKEDDQEFCHQCKKPRDLSTMIHCFREKKRKYCEHCLWNRYGVRLHEAMKCEEWLCPDCEGRCNCATCHKSNSSPSHVLAENIGLLDENFVSPVSIKCQIAVTDQYPELLKEQKEESPKIKDENNVPVDGIKEEPPEGTETEEELTEEKQQTASSKSKGKPKERKGGKRTKQTVNPEQGITKRKYEKKPDYITKQCDNCGHVHNMILTQQMQESNSIYWHCMECVNRVFWVKLSFLVAWPARIVNLDSVNERTLKELETTKQKPTDRVAYFFGDNSYSYSSPENIFSFSEKFEERIRNGKSKKTFQKAVKEALTWIKRYEIQELPISNEDNLETQKPEEDTPIKQKRTKERRANKQEGVDKKYSGRNEENKRKNEGETETETKDKKQRMTRRSKEDSILQQAEDKEENENKNKEESPEVPTNEQKRGEKVVHVRSSRQRKPKPVKRLSL